VITRAADVVHMAPLLSTDRDLSLSPRHREGTLVLTAARGRHVRQGARMYETTMTMIGRLATAVSGVNFNDGGLKATFRLASTERRFDRGLQQWVDGSRLFLTVVCWRALAEHVLATLGVGDPVIVQGRLRSREYEKDGRVHSVIEIEAAAVGPDLARCTATVARKSSQPAIPAPRFEESAAVPAGDRATRPEDGAAAEPETWNSGPLVPEQVGPDRHGVAEGSRHDEAAVRV
jgi:single-strand DNA-binding protein